MAMHDGGIMVRYDLVDPTLCYISHGPQTTSGVALKGMGRGDYKQPRSTESDGTGTKWIRIAWRAIRTPLAKFNAALDFCTAWE